MGLLVTACGGDDDSDPSGTDEDCVTEGITYTDDIKAIFDTNCATTGCHNDTNLANGFSLDNYMAASGAVLFPNFMPSINHEDGVIAMPYPPGSDKIAQCDIDKIKAWIDADLPE